MGSAALWQGFGLRAVELNLARGYQASLSTVELFVRGWGPGKQVLTPAPDDEPPALSPGDAELVLVAAQGHVEREPPTWEQVPWSGWLTLAEVEDGTVWGPIAYGPLYLVQVEELERSDDLDAAARWSVLRLTLADRRWRWGDGVLRRWCFNRASAAGELVPDSLVPQGRPRAGQPWQQDEVLGEVTRFLRGAPQVLRSPARLAVAAGPVTLPPWSPALAALGELGRRHHLEEPCLTWDGRVEFYDPGEAAPFGDDLAGQLVGRLPAELREWVDGRGTAHQVELGWPADYVLVVGGERIATAAVDAWEPVLQDDTGAYAPLSEEALRGLAGGAPPPGTFATWMDWLAVWILGPRSHKGIPGLSRALAERLDQQAWRLYAPPGVVRSDRRGPSRLTHLLPLAPRAEVSADGRRLPVTVLTSSFGPVHVELRGENERARSLRNARAALAAVARAANETLRIRSGARNLFEGFARGLPEDLETLGVREERLPGDTIRGLLTELLAGGGLTFEELAQQLERARRAEQLGRLDPTLRQGYEESLRALYRLEGGDRDLLFDAAKLIADVERQLREDSGALDVFVGVAGLLAERPNLQAVIRNRVRQLEVELQRRRAEREEATRTGAQPELVAATHLIHENRPRDVDAGASIWDAELGVIHTSRLAGHLQDPAQGDQGATRFVAKPVRVLWGVQVRPRRDLLPGQLARPVTQSAPDTEPDVIPSGRTDEDSWFTAVYQRGPGGVAIALPEFRAPDPYGPPAPAGNEARREHVLSRATPVEAPELVELIPLPPARGNELELDRGAFEHAAGRLARRPLIREDRATFARPHRVRLDGVVAQVTIRSAENGAGFQTVVATGSSEAALDPYRTRVRPRARGGDRDGKRREGTRTR